MLTLIGVLIVIAGFVLRLNPLLVVMCAAIATGLAGGLGPRGVVETFGKAFIDNRFVATVWLVLPVIGLLERSGLKERAQSLISQIHAATAGRVLLAYFALRQITAALGLISLGGQAQMVRPLVAPMAEGAAEARFGTLAQATRHEIRAHAAAADNIGVFFGEDIFIAIGSILLIKGFLEQNGISIQPTQLALWAIPTAIAAFLIHGTRLLLLDRRLARLARAQAEDAPMITLQFIYILMGAMVGGAAVVNLLDVHNPKRWANAAFWGIYAVTFLAGSALPHLVSGILVILMALVASVGRVGQGAGRVETTTREEREASAKRWGNLLFVPALTIPLVTLLGTLFLKSLQFHGAPLVDPKNVTTISLGIATLVSLAIGFLILRPPALAPVREARRLLDAVGWAAVLPQMLAALGALFAIAGVGQVVSTLLGRWIPLDTPFVVVATYTVGMALFTMIMGNAFAAFPVMTAAIGLPILVLRFGGDPAVITAIGMLSGFCGTLMTPMAANYNVVPVALLELPDPHAVIKKQIPTGLLLLATNTLLMYLLAFNR